MAYSVKNITYSGKGVVKKVIILNTGKLLDYAHGDWQVKSVGSKAFKAAEGKLIRYNHLAKVVVGEFDNPTCTGYPEHFRIRFHQASGFFFTPSEAYVDVNMKAGESVIIEL
jgi:hypothetical protein